ncbi:MAG: hypothetical protein DWQ35_10490 [Planctomycetota bacterium]|nr:MAG: hypothetical protein DWQ35_10490 [Planctomycetota bacterium]REK40857.1 MAG: hypothetical protein DWQ46_15300 [Planctomycetota bacterium]
MATDKAVPEVHDVSSTSMNLDKPGKSSVVVGLLGRGRGDTTHLRSLLSGRFRVLGSFSAKVLSQLEFFRS